MRSDRGSRSPGGSGTPLSSVVTVFVVLGMIAVPAALTLGRVRVPAVVDVATPNPSPYGYTVSLLLFAVPIAVILWWLVPRAGVRISKRSVVRTIALLFPLGVVLDFFFAHLFLKFPNPGATLRIPAPALGDCGTGYVFVGSAAHPVIGGVPVEEYIFYFTGFLTVLLLYMWLDEAWLGAYSVPGEAAERTDFERLLQFHPASLLLGVGLIAGAVLARHVLAPGEAGFPGYFTFLVIGALGPSAALFPSALPVVNWRAFSMTLFLILLTSVLWEATLGVPYGWWDYQPAQMIGIHITAWNHLPVEAICVWVAVCYLTVLVYEVVKRWQSSGRGARQAFLG